MNIHGDSGEYGSFQFMPATWHDVSIEIIGHTVPQTALNEQYVAVKKIQQLLNEGRTARQIALIWNGSLAGSEKPIEKKGINRHGIRFNTTVYAETVLNNLQNNE